MNEEQVLSLVRKHVPEAVREKISMDSELFKGGFLDSLGFIEMVSDLEERAEINIDAGALDWSQISTPRRIFGMVADLSNKGRAS